MSLELHHLSERIAKCPASSQYYVDRAAFYALMQLPVYRDYNGLQLSAKRQLITGIQVRF